MGCGLILVSPGGLKAVITDRRNGVSFIQVYFCHAFSATENKTAPQVSRVLASSHISFYQNVPVKYLKKLNALSWCHDGYLEVPWGL